MRVTCHWNLDGRSFNTEKDLDDYIISKYGSNIDKESDIVFEKSSKSNRTIEILKTAGNLAKERLNLKRNSALEAMEKREMNRVELIESKTVDDTPAEAYSDDYQAVSEYVYNTGELSRMDVDKYVKHRLSELSQQLNTKDLERISEVRKNNHNLITDSEIFDKVIDLELKEWKYIRKAGKALDRLFGIVINQRNLYYNYFVDADGKFNIDSFINEFSDKKDSKGESWYDLEGLYTEETQSDGTIKKVSPVLQNFVEQVQKLKRNELNIKFTDEVFYQYDADFATSSDLTVGIRGKMDIVIVRPGGRVDVYDIKLSSKDAGGFTENSEWDNDKVKATEYQLGFYGRMIENLGINPSKISLNVIPIQLRNIKNNFAGDIRVNKPIKVIPRSDVQNFINKTIPVTLVASPESEEIRTDIKETLEKMFPTMLINNQILNINEDYLFENKKIWKEGSKFKFINNISKKSEPVYADSKEEILEKYKEYLKDKIDNSDSWFNFLKNNLEGALNKFSELKFNPFETLFDNKIPANIQLNFRKYFSNEGWEIADLSPEINAVLDGLNTIILYNPKLGIYDIISLSSLNLDHEIKLTFGKNIYGNYRSDVLAAKAKKSSIGNILLMRNMTIANILNKYIPNEDFVFGDISVFDSRNDKETSYGKMWSVPAYTLVDDSKTLFGLAKSKFTLASNNIASVDDHILSLFNLILRSSNESEYSALPGARLGDKASKNLGGMIKTFSTLESEKDRLDMLSTLWERLNEVYGKNETTISKLMESRDFDSYIYRETARLLALSSNTFMDLYNLDNLPKWGFENYIKKSISRELMNGTMTMTIDTIPIAKTVHVAMQKVNQRVRDDMLRYKNSKNREMFKKVGLDSNFGMFDVKRFYDESEEGKKFFLYKNPEKDSSLTLNERIFLEWYLKELNNKRSGRTLSEDEIIEMKQNGEYYQVPLLRRSNFSRMVNGRSGKAFSLKEQYNEAVNEWYNLRNAAGGQEEYFGDDSDYRDMVSMYNTFNATLGAREKLIADCEGNIFDKFESHPEIILDEFVRSKIVEEQYNKVLPPITAAIASLQALGFSSGVDVTSSYNFINDFIKSAIFNESLLEKGELMKTISVLKNQVSKAVLGFNPLSGGKEVLNGIYYHYTRAIGNKFDKDKVGISDITKAYATVWTDASKQIGTITKLEKMNLKFGFSNMDINSLTEQHNYYKSDPLRFKYFMFWTNRAPDFLNRMTIFVGYTYKYGCYDAYFVDKDTGELKYDWKKDGRFNLIASNDKSNMTAYLEQRALYSKMMLDLIGQGYEYVDPATGRKRDLKWDANNFESKDNDELPEGFTNMQIRAIKQESDRAFGYMDHDTKSMMFKLGITAVFFQFKTFATAKLNQWFLRPGGDYDQGYYKHAKDEITGEPLYRRVFLLEDGSWDCEFVTTLFITENGLKIELEPVKQWVGSQMEGMLWSFIDLINVFNLAKTKDFWIKEEYAYKRANFAIAMQELMLLLLLGWLIAALYPDENPRDIDNLLERNAMIMLSNSSQDLNPITTIFKGNLTLDFTAFDFMERLVPEVVGATLGMDNRSFYKAFSRLGMFASFRKELYDMHVESKE